MPELPEVETVKRSLNASIVGESIENIDIYREKNILNDKEEFLSALIGERFLSVSRRGKFLIFHLSHEKAIISHLRMEGKYYIGQKEEEKGKHDILRYVFASGKTLRYIDVRKFGIIEYRKESELYDRPPLSNLGKEPFDISAEELMRGLKKKKGPIKEALLDQSIISGIGNIYDDEILFASGINPLKIASSLNEEDCVKIVANSKRIMEEAIALGGSTIKSYHPEKGKSGAMQNHLKVYGKLGENCPNCGFPLKKIAVGGRGTTYCPLCQKGDKPLVFGVTGPIASGKSTVAAYLKSKGYLVLDADKIVSSLYKEKDVLKNVQAILGKDAITDGALNRPYVRELLSSDVTKKKALEGYIWPLVYQKMEEEINKEKDRRILLDVPFLLSSPLEKYLDLLIYIEADPKVEETRIRERGKDPASSLALNAFFPREKAKKKANIVLSGNGSKESLLKELEKISYL